MLRGREEHINSDGESHYSQWCPGPDECAVQRGLLRLLALLDSGDMVMVETTPATPTTR